MGVVKHPSGINDELVQKVVARRGRLHAYSTINPAKTALVVIDLDVGSVKRDPNCLSIVEPVNTVAAATRRAGGVVAWVTTPITKLQENFVAMYGADRAQMHMEESRPAVPNANLPLWQDLDSLPADIYATKRGSSAFFPGKANLQWQLQARNITTVLIAGTVTNICCESSARDAAELDYKVIMVSDGLAGHSFGLHEASLATIYRCFGDVRPAHEIVALLG